MAPSSTRAFREEPPELVARRTEEGNGPAEVTLYEATRAPDERTTRWITADAPDCIPADEWR
ncbi:hypothetical protein GRS48_00750 [Halorubrum sp. JWXQ-INN 858]|uniref:DUF7511 domain-containing protein n=1 Tax=Halorubrum sp. JWXQ-INN 858 TaxID=2690782 RepID=UPI00135AB0AF|nr:hypothetical protein [Halorubrum sp. JWXQ-INN 858]MWV63362.1 hypothetical protein [Halorubrum sp. JWXQ-INN 858]